MTLEELRCAVHSLSKEKFTQTQKLKLGRITRNHQLKKALSRFNLDFGICRRMHRDEQEDL